ncbi:MAG TPA: hypothetical protein VEK55_13400, partial [Xanthobacteraceae bacterium]|nr:hypothetical protein [Xanthobacteraceae bacterium]
MPRVGTSIIVHRGCTILGPSFLGCDQSIFLPFIDIELDAVTHTRTLIRIAWNLNPRTEIDLHGWRLNTVLSFEPQPNRAIVFSPTIGDAWKMIEIA